MKNILFFLITGIFLFSCGSSEEKKTEDNVFYTCSMDPQVMEKKPGKCPICHMDLTKTIVDPLKSGDIKLNAEQIKLGNIATDTVGMRYIGNGKTLSATVVPDQNKNTSVTSWVEGRIEKIYFKSVGEKIEKGQPVYEIYSEQLITTQKDYLIALKQNSSSYGINYKQLAETAKQKLLLWGMSPEQIKDLSEKEEVKNVITVYSAYSGVISEIMFREGDYVAEGGLVFKLNDLSTLWVEAQLYASEVSAVSGIKEAEITFPSLPGKKVKGKVTFINPELSRESKIVIVRIEIPNSSALIKAGMQANITLQSTGKKALSLPSSAILLDEKGATVWIKKQENSFVPRMVTTGAANNGYTEITSGLEEGDIVVISGAYLLQSEYIFKNGADPMEGMEM